MIKLFTTCLNYADFLDITLQPWTDIGEVFVITAEVDKETQRVAARHGAHVEITDAWYLNGASCNKGAAMNAVIHQRVFNGEVIAVFDADCFPRGTLTQYPQQISYDEMIGCERVACKTPVDFVANLRKKPAELKPMVTPPYVDRPHLNRGYFQLFRYRGELQFGAAKHKTFSGCDLYFAAQFPKQSKMSVEQFVVLHMGQHGRNWKGRITRKWESTSTAKENV